MWLCMRMSMHACARWLHLKDGPLWQTICLYLPVCLRSFLHVSVSLWRAALLRCFVLIQWHEQTAVQFIYMMIDDVCWIMARSRHEAWQGAFQETPTEPELSLPWLPWLHAGSKVRQPRRGCEKPCLIPSSGTHWGFHTFLSGHSGKHCYSNRALLTFWPNGWLSLTTTNLFCFSK